MEYSKIDSNDFKKSYTDKLKKIISLKKISEVTSFEIEDKFFENKIKKFFHRYKIKCNILKSQMFLN